MNTLCLFVPVFLSSLLIACGADADNEQGVPGAADAAIAQSDADLSMSDAMLPGVNCSLPAELGTSFTMVSASGNGFSDNPLDIEVVATMSDKVVLFFTSYNAKPVPLGKKPMQGQWLDGNCEFCLFVNSVDTDAQEEHLWFPIAGEIDVVSVKDNFVLTGTDLVFQHVQFVGNTLAVEPDPDGCTTTIPTLQINTPMHVGNQ